MKQQISLSIFLLLLLVSISYAAVVDTEIIKELNQNDTVSVIVVLKEDSQTASPDLKERKEAIAEKQDDVLEDLNLEDHKSFLGINNKEQEFELERKYETTNAFAGEVNEEGLDKLKNNPNVEKVFFNKILSIDLTTSVPQINADDVQALSISDSNITGAGETVCVIDTGIDTDHTAFTGRILDQYCYCNTGGTACCTGSTTEASTAEDDNGHGTHVTGIAAGNDSTYRGVAYEAGIISIKACNSAGNCGTNDIISAIDWCTNNATKYNISVIHMSLGDDSVNNVYCSGDTLEPSINAAHAVNINVVISSGNNAPLTTGISSPACIENATPVGAVDDSDGILYRRGNILKILAPGATIFAPTYDGSTGSKSGTSMSAPHVSGAILLMRQYWTLAYNTSPLPDFIENKIAITGKLIDDTANSGNNYSRLDVLGMVQPYINYTNDSPANDTIISATSTIINITSDVNLTGALLEWNFNNGTITNYTMTQNNFTNFQYNITGLSDGSFIYRVYGNDSVNTFGLSPERTFITDLNGPNISFYNPLNNSFLNSVLTLNVSLNDNVLIESYYNITNESNDLVDSNINTSINAATYTWTDNINFSNATFPDGNYSINVYANDSIGNIVTDSINLTIDKTKPGLSNFNVSPTTINVNSTVTFHVNITDSYLNTSSIYVQSNFSGSEINYTLVQESGDTYNFTFNGTNNLSNQENVSYIFHAADNAGNLNTSDTYSFFVENRNITSASITTPANNTVLEAGNATTFSVTGNDPDSDTLTYSWEFGDGTTSTSQSPSKTFNTTNTFVNYVNVSDSYGSVNTTSVTVIVNDTTGPTTSAITYDSELHIESEGADYFVNGTFFDYSGIFNSSLFFNDTKQTDTCTDSNTTWVCTWNVTNLTVGSYTFTTNITDNFSTQHTNSTSYSFTVTTCSDSTQNGDESGTDCGGSCSTACAVVDSGSSSSSGGGAGGGGGGGGGGSISTSSKTDTTPSESASSSTGGSGGVSRKISDEILSTVGNELGTSKLNVIEESKSSGTSGELSALSSAINSVKNEVNKKIVQEIQRTVEKKLVNKLEITKNLVTYRVEDPETNNAIFRSKIFLTFTAPEDLTNINIIEVIPKEVAMYASTITFPNEKPVVLEEDPVVQWHFDSMTKGETKELSYIVKKKVTEITSTTIGTAQPKKADAERKQFDFTLIKNILTNKILWIVVGSIFIIVILFFIIRRVRQEDEF